jgi:hypothetical protein
MKLAWAQFGLLTLISIIMVGCQTTGPKFEVARKEQFWLDGFAFEKSVATDANGSGQKLVEVRPVKLPYTGTIADMKAQDRWLRIFESLMKAVAEECKGDPERMPEVSADELDYTKVNSSKEHPRYGQARFTCRSK